MLAPRQADLWWGMLSAGPGSYQPAPQGGEKVNGGGWEDTRGLQTTVPQSAISDILERPGSVGQDGQLPSLLSTRPRSSVSCGTADTILFIGCNIRKPLWWWSWRWPSQWLLDVTVYFPACCPGNAKETWNEQGPNKQRWVAVVLWVACQRGCLLNHGLDHLAWQQRAADEEEAHLRHHCWHMSHYQCSCKWWWMQQMGIYTCEKWNKNVPKYGEMSVKCGGRWVVCTLVPCNKCQLQITLLCRFLMPHELSNAPENIKYILNCYFFPPFGT